MRVLEIGCGAGLLAAHGRACVTTCESNPMVAAAAREVVRRNGPSDRIRIVDKSSLDLTGPDDLPERADLVRETFGRRLFDEGVVRALSNARERLLKSGARSVPASAAIRFALAGDHRGREESKLHDVLGCNLSAFRPLHQGHEALRRGPVDQAGPWARYSLRKLAFRGWPEAALGRVGDQSALPYRHRAG